MPNVFKSGNTATNGSIYDGNFTIGIDSTFDFGPTSATSFWNGVTPPSGGYTIYQNKAANGPSIRTAENDTQLVSVLQSMGSTGTTAAGALNWARQQSEIMVANIDYYDIVTSGLTFAVDASYAPSYPQSGRTWYDLTRNGNNLDITSGLFSKVSGGTLATYLSASTTNNNITGTSYTICAFVRPAYVSPGSSFIIGTSNGLSGPNIRVNDSFTAATFNSITVNRVVGNNFNTRFFYFVGVQDGTTQNFYVNGTLSGTTTATNTNFGSTLNLGRFVSSRYTEMSSASFQIYNRALSQTEVTKNWNALKTRFFGL